MAFTGGNTGDADNVAKRTKEYHSTIFTSSSVTFRCNKCSKHHIFKIQIT